MPAIAMTVQPLDLRSTSLVFALAVISLIISVSSIALMYWTRPSDPKPQTDALNGEPPIYGSRELYECIGSTLKVIRPPQLNVGLYEQVWQLCGNQFYALDSLNDFTIRKQKFLRQQLDERVVLWMVVAITLSGVGLAGLQLLASFKLASSGVGTLAQDSDILVARDKISLKSSVTGLVILVLSLAFFIVYVLGVYTIREERIQGPVGTQFAPLNLPGGLGPPPRISEGSSSNGQTIQPRPPEASHSPTQ